MLHYTVVWEPCWNTKWLTFEALLRTLEVKRTQRLNFIYCFYTRKVQSNGSDVNQRCSTQTRHLPLLHLDLVGKRSSLMLFVE